MDQKPLWHDSLEDALRDVIYALGPKKAAGDLWPDKDPTHGVRALHHALDPERAEKLSISEIVWLLREGSMNSHHMAMAHLSAVCGYRPPEPTTPEDERAQLQREFIEAKKEFSRLAARIERLR